ncbi:hypothetical protein JOM56_015341 [Amanita muscaria]
MLVCHANEAYLESMQSIQSLRQENEDLKKSLEATEKLLDRITGKLQATGQSSACETPSTSMQQPNTLVSNCEMPPPLQKTNSLTFGSGLNKGITDGLSQQQVKRGRPSKASRENQDQNHHPYIKDANGKPVDKDRIYTISRRARCLWDALDDLGLAPATSTGMSEKAYKYYSKEMFGYAFKFQLTAGTWKLDLWTSKNYSSWYQRKHGNKRKRINTISSTSSSSSISPSSANSVANPSATNSNANTPDSNDRSISPNNSPDTSNGTNGNTLGSNSLNASPTLTAANPPNTTAPDSNTTNSITNNSSTNNSNAANSNTNDSNANDSNAANTNPSTSPGSNPQATNSRGPTQIRLRIRTPCDEMRSPDHTNQETGGTGEGAGEQPEGENGNDKDGEETGNSEGTEQRQSADGERPSKRAKVLVPGTRNTPKNIARQEWLEKNPGGLEADFEKYYKSQPKKGDATSTTTTKTTKAVRRLSFNQPYNSKKHRSHVRRMLQLHHSQLDKFKVAITLVVRNSKRHLKTITCMHGDSDLEKIDRRRQGDRGKSKGMGGNRRNRRK